MSSEYIEAVLYDWHNDIILGHQNKDIDFYNNHIIKNKIKKTLVVGAGTGRVAIPISKYTCVTALDVSLGRLIRLSEKNSDIKIVACDFLEYETFEKYDLIILPYSTIQAISKDYDCILSKIKELSTGKTKCLIDYDDSFRYVASSEEKIKCRGYSTKLKANVEEFDTINKLNDSIEVIRKFTIGDESIIFNEKWYIFDEERFKEVLLKIKLCKTNKYIGYNSKAKSHKIILELMANNLD